MAKEVFSLTCTDHNKDLFQIVGHFGGGDTDRITEITVALAEYFHASLKIKMSKGDATILLRVLSAAIEQVKMENPDFAAETRALAIQLLKAKNKG